MELVHCEELVQCEELVHRVDLVQCDLHSKNSLNTNNIDMHKNL